MAGLSLITVLSAPSTPAETFTTLTESVFRISPKKRPISQPSPSPPHKKITMDATTRTSSRGTDTSEIEHSSRIPAISATDRRFVVYPEMKIFKKDFPEVQKTYEDNIRQSLLQYCENAFANYCLGLASTGFTEEEAEPAVIVIASDVSEDQAYELKDLVVRCDTEIVKCWVYVGTTVRDGNSVDFLQDFTCEPMIGSSLGVVNASGSFSLGAYIKLEGLEPEYVATVHHGVSSTSIPVTPLSHPPIRVQQPSSSDYENTLASLENRLAMWLDPESPVSRIPSAGKSRTLAESDLQDYKEKRQQSEYGTVRYSEMRTIKQEDRVSSSDWALVEVTSSRLGQNCMRRMNEVKDSHKLLPRDFSCYYVTAEGDLRIGMPVYKQGRSTGATAGDVSFIRWDCKIPGNDVVTSEFCVASCTEPFSMGGDSGAGVLTQFGMFVGQVFAGTEGTRVPVIGQEHLGEVHVSYIQPWTLVKNQIEKVTGRKVTLRVIDESRLVDSWEEVKPLSKEKKD